MKAKKPIATALAVIAAAVPIAACGSDNGGGDNNASGAAASSDTSTLPKGSEPVDLNPAEFTTEINNPYWPMEPGSEWVYRETGDKGEELRVEVTVTDDTKMIANGIEARVVHDVVSDAKTGDPIEITDDWYAQDSDGNVWYLGEQTAEYENGKVKSRAGSFEAGVDGAQPGIIMPGDPQVGVEHRQEYLAGEAEDKAKVLSLDEQAKVPFGSFDGVLVTEDTNPLNKPEPAVEHKFFAKGVGPVLVTSVSGTTGTEELVSYTEGK